MSTYPDFTIKRGDRLPVLEAVCIDKDTDPDTPVDLTSAASVKFIMRKQGSSTTKVSATATFGNRPDGEVYYEWAANDTDTAGDFDGEFELTWSDGKVQTFPNNGHIRIKIRGDLG